MRLKGRFRAYSGQYAPPRRGMRVPRAPRARVSGMFRRARARGMRVSRRRRY